MVMEGAGSFPAIDNRAKISQFRTQTEALY